VQGGLSPSIALGTTFVKAYSKKNVKNIRIYLTLNIFLPF